MPWMASLHEGRNSVIVFGLLLALFLLLIARNVSSEPYVYDEADYMYAASLGFAANWSDTPSITISDFVQAGLGRESRQISWVALAVAGYRRTPDRETPSVAPRIIPALAQPSFYIIATKTVSLQFEDFLLYVVS